MWFECKCQNDSAADYEFMTLVGPSKLTFTRLLINLSFWIPSLKIKMRFKVLEND